MAQFQVPQFIETESKIVGPLTLKQFLYLAGAGLASFFLFFVLQTWLWFIVTALMGITAAAFAFLKVNGRPLTVIFQSAFLYFWQPKLYLWQRKEAEAAKETEGPKLKSLWKKLLTTTSSVSQREKAPTQIIKKIQQSYSGSYTSTEKNNL